MSFFIPEALAASSQASAQVATTGGASMFMMPLVFLAIFYFLLWRPQSKRQKEQKEMVESIQKGDEVVTSGGLLGRVSTVNDKYLSLSIADDVTIKIQRMSISGVLPKGTIKAIN